MAATIQTSDTQTIERDRLSLERDRLKFERQKLSIELIAKRREAATTKPTALRELFSNPLTLVIVGGFISLMTTIVSGFYTAAENRNAEGQKAELARRSAQDALQAELIKKFTEGPREVVRENLKFLQEAGLIPTYAKDIRSYLERNPEAAPQAASMGGIQDADDAVPLDLLPETDPLRTTARSVGQLKVEPGMRCTAFLIAPDRAITASFCMDRDTKRAALTINGRTLAVRLIRQVADEPGKGGYSILALKGDTRGLVGLRLATQAPAIGTPLKLIMFRASNAPWANPSPDCRVLALSLPNAFSHGCDSGGGSAGAPILSADGKLVIGIHTGRDTEGTGTGIGTLASTVKP
jgi:hypothetical protein